MTEESIVLEKDNTEIDENEENAENDDTRDAVLYPFLQWNCEDVANWIEQLGFPYYRDCFQNNFINGRKLVLVTASTLTSLGINNFEHIKIITKCVRQLLELEYPDWNRSISLPPRNVSGMYLEQKAFSGEAKDNLKYSHFKAQFSEYKWRPTLNNHISLLPRC